MKFKKLYFQLFFLPMMILSVCIPQDSGSAIKMNSLEDKYVQDYLLKDNLTGKVALYKAVENDIDENLGWGYDEEVAIFLQIWKIKSYFISGNIDSSKSFYNNLREMTVVDESAWGNYLYHEPYSDDMIACQNTSCMCKKINIRNNNLDILHPDLFNQHFKDLRVEFGNNESKVLKIDRRSEVRGEADKDGNRERVVLLIDPPNAVYKDMKYSSDFSDEELLEYYFINAKRYRLNNLEDDYIKRDPVSYPLQFIDSYTITSDLDPYWSKKIKYLPTVTTYHIDDANKTYYKFYVRDGSSIKSRYSYALIEDEFDEEYEDESKTKKDTLSLLIPWDDTWKMHEIKEEGRVVFVVPSRYVEAFKVDGINIKEKLRLRENYDIIISDDPNQELLDKYDLDDRAEHISVYEIIYPFNAENYGEIEIEFTKNYTLYNEEKEKISWERRFLYFCFLVCMGALYAY